MFSKRIRELLESGVKYPLAKQPQKPEEEIIKLSSNENPLGPSPKAVEVLKKEADEVNRYPNSGSIELKRKISNYIGAEPDEICVGNGSDELMDIASKTFLDPNDKCLVPLPTFAEYEITCRVNCGKPKFVNLPKFEWRTEDLIKGLNDAKLAFICRPNNPTGNGIEEEGLRKLLETGKEIIVDEAYAEFAGYSAVNLLGSYKNLTVLRTFSKFFGLAGLRVGYAISNPETIKSFERVRQPFNVNLLAQKAAIAALDDQDFQQKVKKMINKGRDYLREELSKLGLRILPSEANFVMANVRGLKTDATSLCDYLAKRGILIRNLSSFRGAGPDWVRITVGKPNQNAQLIKVLKDFKRE